ncbi:hypothetical protein F5146DRAFT_1007639 [Armillaria mellea]|nr:hypothetical protein F5146DRAFT_1007639 [Armillaria mellea]
MAALAPHIHTEHPKNTFIFDPDPHSHKTRRLNNAWSYLSDLAEYCPYRAGEAVIKKVEYMKSNSLPSLFGQALDLFAIYCNLVIEFKDYDVLSTLTFNDDSTFVAEQAAVAAMVASGATDKYSAITHQCYWYAWVIFNIIVETQAGQYTKRPFEDDKQMGRHRKLRIINDAASNLFIPLVIPQND